MEITLLSLLESDLPFLIEVRNDESTRSQLENDSLFTLEECKACISVLQMINSTLHQTPVTLPLPEPSM